MTLNSLGGLVRHGPRLVGKGDPSIVVKSSDASARVYAGRATHGTHRIVAEAAGQVAHLLSHGQIHVPGVIEDPAAIDAGHDLLIRLAGHNRAAA